MGRIAVLVAQKLVEARSWLGERVRNRDPEAPESRGADRHQEGLDQLDAALQILEPLPDEVLAGSSPANEPLATEETVAVSPAERVRRCSPNRKGQALRLF